MSAYTSPAVRSLHTYPNKQQLFLSDSLNGTIFHVHLHLRSCPITLLLLFAGLVHTFMDETDEAAAKYAREPLTTYLMLWTSLDFSFLTLLRCLRQILLQSPPIASSRRRV